MARGSVTTRFLYDGDELVAEYDGAGTTMRRYVHGIGIDDPILWYEGAGLTARRSLFQNHQGSVTGVADASGNAIAINGYDSWGIPNAGNVGRFQFTGQAWLEELGMYHYKARIYSPTLGRFLQTDPVGYEDQINLYAYAGNDPLNMLDPTGQDANMIIRENGDVEVELPILFYGDAANAANIAEVVDSMEWGVTQNVSGTNISLNVTVLTEQDVANGAPIVNRVELANGPLPGGPNNGHSYVDPNQGNSAHISMDDTRSFSFVDHSGTESVGAKGPMTGAHYAGHLMGLTDTRQSGGALMDEGWGRGMIRSDLRQILQTDPPGTGVRNTITRCPHSDCR